MKQKLFHDVTNLNAYHSQNTDVENRKCVTLFSISSNPRSCCPLRPKTKKEQEKDFHQQFNVKPNAFEVNYCSHFEQLFTFKFYFGHFCNFYKENLWSLQRNILGSTLPFILTMTENRNEREAYYKIIKD